MWSDKPSIFCNYLVKPHLFALCDSFTFGARMRPRAKISSRKQRLEFN
jgi:hypothetical protein